MTNRRHRAAMQRKIDVLRTKYPGASWALWSPEFPNSGCPEEDSSEFLKFIDSNIDRLRSEIVFLSLNPAGKAPTDFLNFHSTDSKHYDARLRRLVEESGLEGAYMTDLVMDTVNPDSKLVNDDRLDVLVFLNQLNLLDQSEYHVICFLEKAYEALKTHFRGKERSDKYDIKTFSADWNDNQLHVHRVWFFGNWGANADKIPKLQNQLKYLSEEIISED